jgi:hydroxyacylglutathione hydrolase
MKTVSIVVLLTCMLLPATVYPDDAAEITATELLELIAAGKAPVIVDVRSVAEYKSGHVPGAIHISFWSAYWDSEKIPASGADPVVVYCASGPRAKVAGLALRWAGIPNVLYLKGHMTGWKGAKLPTVSGQNPASKPSGS